jgi:hypothetical protein
LRALSWTYFKVFEPLGLAFGPVQHGGVWGGSVHWTNPRLASTLGHAGGAGVSFLHGAAEKRSNPARPEIDQAAAARPAARWHHFEAHAAKGRSCIHG